MTVALIRGFGRLCLAESSLLQCRRAYSSEKLPGTAGKYSRKAVRRQVQGYVSTRFIDYLKNYDKVLEQKFPSAVKAYRVFFEGVREFSKDMKRYLKVTRIANASAHGLKALTRNELELYLQMPKDMIKVAPALLGSALPIVGYLVFPIAFMFPRVFLTSHFWSLQQKSEFNSLFLKDRLMFNRKVFRCLQAKLDTVKTDPNYKKFNQILGLLGSGLHPTPDDIINIKDLFTKAPYQFNSLSNKHLKCLCHMHGLRGGLFKSSRLIEHANIVHHMDLAITREGDVHNMLPDALKHACYIRGLNPTNMSNEKMIEWLRDWVKVSLAIKVGHLSLFLHLPILLGYNHPNNWRLIYNIQEDSDWEEKFSASGLSSTDFKLTYLNVEETKSSSQ